MLVLDFNDRFVAIECKSSKDESCPMWNDSLPNPNTIYILSSGKVNETTIFLGKDVITDKEVEIQNQFWSEYKLLEEKYRNIMMPFDIFSRGWQPKARPQNFQIGGSSKTDYFTHSDRNKCEINALEYAKQ